jgi:uncharacterized membrane protein YccC
MHETMPGIIDRLRALTATAPNRIALATAVRGTIATATPLLLLSFTSHAAFVHFVVIGALNTSMVDLGGLYRSRLAVMALYCALGPVLMLVGAAVADWWWAAAPIMFLTALGSGMARALGPGTVALGLNVVIAMLIGIQVAGEPIAVELAWAGALAVGGIWTILVALAFWQLRPFRRLELELAAATEAVANLVAVVTVPKIADDTVVTRRRYERRLAARHRAAREAIERVHDALGEVRAETFGPGTTMAQLLVVVRSVSRIAAAAVALGEATRTAAASQDDLRLLAVVELEAVCRRMARLLLTGEGELAVEKLRDRLAALTRSAGESRDPARAAEAMAVALAVRHLDNADEALGLLFGTPRRWRDRLRQPLTSRSPKRALGSLFRAHLTKQSVIFRHAFRVAAVSAVATAIIVYWRLPHGMWLPMTALIILQPEFGGTLTRALQRTAGTMAGAVVAGLLLATLQNGLGYEFAVSALLFATFLLLRRRYAYGVTFLTPLIILLLGLSGPSPWFDVRNRIIYTLSGAAIALAGGYLLWPQWERERLPRRLARAVRADMKYLDAVLAALATPATPDPALGRLRREAEIEVGNAGAAFQRMLAEPARHRRRIARIFALVTYIERLCRHTITLDGLLGAETRVWPAEPVTGLRRFMEATLTEVADALEAGRRAKPTDPPDEVLARLATTAQTDPEREDNLVPPLLGQIAGDGTSLAAAINLTWPHAARENINELRDSDLAAVAAPPNRHSI